MIGPGLRFPLNFFNEMWARIDGSNKVEHVKKSPKTKTAKPFVNHQARYKAIRRTRRNNPGMGGCLQFVGKPARKATMTRASERIIKAA